MYLQVRISNFQNPTTCIIPDDLFYLQNKNMLWLNETTCHGDLIRLGEHVCRYISIRMYVFPYHKYVIHNE